jgi:lipopolysaccharide/colanic/teichoic acid biosynthesis glycosyltransferase
MAIRHYLPQTPSGAFSLPDPSASPSIHYFERISDLGPRSRWIFGLQETLKRTFDVGVVLLGLPVALPVLGILAVVLKLDSRGPLLFYQDQLGRHGETIHPLKFRTMVEGAEVVLQEILAQGGPLAEEYEAFHKLKRDPRVTRMGRFLRKFSLDELPQLWNVLKGDMSLVGPRPYLPRELPGMLGLEKTILLVRPGVTGYWQVCGRNETTFRARVKMDGAYVRNWTFSLDLRLFFRTFWVVLKGEGAS